MPNGRPSYNKVKRDRDRVKPCFWCHDTTRPKTVDHLVPRWARAVMAKSLAAYIEETVKACQKCNMLKGPIPPAIFWAVRRDSMRLAAEQRRWLYMSIAASMGMVRPDTDGTYELIASEMLKPFPRSGNTAAPHPPIWREEPPQNLRTTLPVRPKEFRPPDEVVAAFNRTLKTKA